MLAFLYSTPAYRRTLELFGWAELGERLQRMTREGRWDELSTLVTDEVLDALVPQGTYEELPAVIDRWFGKIATGVLIPPARDPADDPSVAALVREILHHLTTGFSQFTIKGKAQAARGCDCENGRNTKLGGGGGGSGRGCRG